VADLIAVSDLPSKLQSTDMVADMVAGANAKASRVAPCLVDPTSTAWAATTAYAVGDRAMLAAGEFVEVTVAGTSGATAPTVPADIDDTVVDDTVTWKRIAPTTDQLAEARLVLLGAVKRWAEAGAGAYSAQQAGPFGVTVDTRQRTGFNLWPSEIEGLQDICATATTSGAFSIDTAPYASAHLPWCDLALGATYCSCGVDIAGEPIYELG
jgi:hypothetical protein